MMKKFALALMATAVAVFSFGVVAEAQYGAGSPPKVSPASVVPGGTFTVAVTGCTPPEVLTTTFNGTTTTTTCVAGGTLSSFIGAALLAQAPTGSATITLTAPTAGGTYNGTIVGSLGYRQSFQVVVSATSVPGGGLPATGSEGISTTMSVAAGLFAVGVGLFGVTLIRRRRVPSVA